MDELFEQSTLNPLQVPNQHTFKDVPPPTPHYTAHMGEVDYYAAFFKQIDSETMPGYVPGALIDPSPPPRPATPMPEKSKPKPRRDPLFDSILGPITPFT